MWTVSSAGEHLLYKDVVVVTAAAVTVKPKMPQSLLAQPTAAPTEVTIELAWSETQGIWSQSKAQAESISVPVATAPVAKVEIP